MCGYGEYHGKHHGGLGYGYSCCCGEWPGPGRHFGFGWRFGPGEHFRRRFPTREERIAWLEEYLKALQAEAKAVEERIAEMKAAR
jgi:hypothetical protein